MVIVKNKRSNNLVTLDKLLTISDISILNKVVYCGKQNVPYTIFFKLNITGLTESLTIYSCVFVLNKIFPSQFLFKNQKPNSYFKYKFTLKGLYTLF